MSKDQRTGWLAKLKEGDKVIVAFSDEEVRTIDKITPTGRINIYPYTFSPMGRGMGYEWRAPRLYEYTPEEAERLRVEAETKKLARKINGYNFFCLPLDKLERIAEILKEN